MFQGYKYLMRLAVVGGLVILAMFLVMMPVLMLTFCWC